MASPMKNRNNDRWSRVGSASTDHGRWNFSTPLAKNARIGARLWGLYRGGCVIVTYRRAHCCNNVASKAHVRAMTKLRNQSELTQIADFEGEKGGG
jgi:hypothetical protein